MAKARIWGDWDPEKYKGNVAIKCPGCNCHHVIATVIPQSNGAIWQFNGNYDQPTFYPSLSIKTGKYIPGHENFDEEDGDLSSICHSYISNGFIQFLNDCTHELKGQTVELPEIQ